MKLNNLRGIFRLLCPLLQIFGQGSLHSSFFGLESRKAVTSAFCSRPPGK